MTVVCITNFLPDFRSCTYRDHHEPTCDGFEYAWNEDHGREEATGRPCRGCEPRKAKAGMLCVRCFDGVVSALAAAPGWLAGMRGVDKAITRDSAGGPSSALGYVPIPGVQLAVDEIRSFDTKPDWMRTESWVATEKGAEDAVRFARAVRAATTAHPLREEPHKIRRTRCPECRQLTLVWHPTTALGGNVTVRCANPECRREIPQDRFEQLAAIENTRTGTELVTTSGVVTRTAEGLWAGSDGETYTGDQLTLATDDPELTPALEGAPTA